MAAPTNISPATATVITSLPYNTTQDVFDTATTYTVYYAYTPTADQEVLAMFTGSFGSGYQPTMTIVNAGGTAITFGAAATIAPINRPCQFPAVAWTTYYFKVSYFADVNPSLLTVNVQAFTPTTTKAGDIFILDVLNGFPGAVVSGQTNYTAVEFVLSMTSGSGQADGDFGDVLTDGTLLLPNILTGQLKRFDSSLTYQSTPLTKSGLTCIRASGDGTTGFYAAFSDKTVHLITAAGVDTGVVASGLAVVPGGIAVNPTGTTLYYTPTPSGNNPIRSWDLGTNTANANFSAAVGTYSLLYKDLLVLSDGKVVAFYFKTTTDMFARIFNSNGTTNRDVPFTGFLPSSTRLATDIDNPLSFRIWLTHTDGFIATFARIKVSDGSTVWSKLETFYDDGVYQGTASATPTARTGVSDSCPLIVLRQAVLVPTFDPIVVERTFLLPAETNLQMFLSRLEIFCQSGVGLTTGQGSDPQLMLKLSRDGGQTWGPELWRSMGAIGEYTHRTYWNRLGRGRNFACRIRCSEPTFLAFLDAYATLEQGTS